MAGKWRVSCKHGNRIDQLSGVAVPGSGKHLVDIAAFDDPPVLHHQHAVRQVTHDTEIVGDEQQRSAGCRLEFREKIENLRLNRNIQCAHRLIGDQEARAWGERPGDGNALALPARKLAGITAEEIAAQPDGFENLQHTITALGSIKPRDIEALADDLLDRITRIERA